MVVTNEVEKIIAELLDPKTTCRACDFVVCPMLGSFAAKLKPASSKIEELEKRLEAAYERISRLSLGLTKIVESTEKDKGAMTTAGFINRVATNALCIRDMAT